MKSRKAYLDERFYGIVLETFCNFLAFRAAFSQKQKNYACILSDSIKGVRHKHVQRKFACTFDCLDKKISETLYVDISYEEGSKKLFVTFKTQSNERICAPLNKAKKKHFQKALARYFDKLLQGLMDVLLPIEDASYQNSGAYLCPYIKCKKLLPHETEILKKPYKFDIIADDILTLLYNIYAKRNAQISFVRVRVDDILFLRGIKKPYDGLKYRAADIKRTQAAIEALSRFNLIYAKKIAKGQYAVIVPENRFEGGYFMSSKILSLNAKLMPFEKILGSYICRCAHLGRFEIKIKTITDYLCKYKKHLKPYQIRNKIEDALDALLDCGFLSNWQYKEIDEESLWGKNWLEAYKKLVIIYEIKKAEFKNHFYRPA